MRRGTESQEILSSRQVRYSTRAIMLSLLLILVAATTQPAQPSYSAHYTRDPITIDGKLDDPAWNAAPWTDDFVDLRGRGRDRPAAPQRTRSKLLWNDEYLYIAAEVSETNIRAAMKDRDSYLFLENAFEVFLDPADDGRDYVEMEFNALNTQTDIFMPRPYREHG